MSEKSSSLHHLLYAGLILVLLFSLAACQRPASNAPSIIPEDEAPPVPEDSIFPSQVTPTATTVGAVVEGEQPGDELPAATATPAADEPAAPVEEKPQAEVKEVKPTKGSPPATYTLQKGEFPFCIARRFDLNQSELLALNGLNLNSKPGVGTVLKLPQTGNGFVTERSLKSHPTQYTVRSGDTLNSIACQFGDVSPDMIQLANDMSSSNVSAGKVLQIP